MPRLAVAPAESTSVIRPRTVRLTPEKKATLRAFLDEEACAASVADPPPLVTADLSDMRALAAAAGVLLAHPDE